MARTPLYKTTETEMISRIERGDWEIGRRLPNEFQLADEFGVSQGTMRRALITLEGQGYLSRKPGRGTLVAANTPAAVKSAAVPAAVPTLSDADGQPLTLDPFRARSGTRLATEREAETMGCKRVATMERTFKHRGRRAALEAVAVPTDLIGGLDEAGPADLRALLEHHGVAVARVEADARAEVTDMSQSVALSVDRHTALLVVRSAAYNSGGHVIGRQILRLAVEDARLTHVSG